MSGEVASSIKFMSRINPTDENHSTFICGRPLGLAFDTITENLIVTDTSTGIFEFNLTTGQKKQLVLNTTHLGNDESVGNFI